MNLQVVVVDPIKALLARLAAAIPVLVGALVILLVGWLIAKIVQKAFTRLLKSIRLDVVSERSGVKAFLEKGGIAYTLSELLGVIGYWVIMLVVLMTAIDALGLRVAAGLLDKIITYIPSVIASIFILVLGLFFAALLGTIVRTAASNAGMKQAKHLGQVAQVIVVIFAMAVALEQLQIGAVIISYTFNIIMAAIGLALAIAFGLGTKDIAGRLVQELIERLKAK